MISINSNEKRSKWERNKIISVNKKQLLLSNFRSTLQEEETSEPINCEGYGRVRHFVIYRHEDWVKNPLPNVPVAKALGKDLETDLTTQIFQIAGCNWYCWYCFVDDELKTGDQSYSRWFTTDELVSMLKKEDSIPMIIDLSGGQPDLVPEWAYWMMQSLTKQNLDAQTYLWSDDSLSTEYYWRYLSKRQRNFVANYQNYGKVCCFKGYDEKTFSFNTSVNPKLYARQFTIFQKFLSENLDLYAYVTFTSPPINHVRALISKFIDDLQKIHDNLPLRTVPLKIVKFRPMEKRMKQIHYQALNYQHVVLENWILEINDRFSKQELATPICDVSLT